MKKIVSSTLAALCIATVASASTQLYTDTSTGQVFTTPGKDRVALSAPSSSSSSSMMDKFRFSGQAFLSYENDQYRDNSAKANVSKFEINRMYIETRAYVFANPKDYMRLTLDVYDQLNTHNKAMRVKYAYLYLNNILPFTSTEIGQVHRPWHDYEEHKGWLYRVVAPTFVENGNGAALGSSAGDGVTFITKTKYLTAMYGVYNGQGYHNDQPSNSVPNYGGTTGMSGEWRLTAHLLGSDKSIKNTYLNVSYYGMYNVGTYQPGGANTAYKNEIYHAFHAVYNMPNFLIAGEYITAPKDFGGLTSVTDSKSKAGSGYSFNVEGRLGANEQYRAFARYDNWTPKTLGQSTTSQIDRRSYILGAAWRQSKHIMWVLSDNITDNERNYSTANTNGSAYMLSAQVDF